MPSYSYLSILFCIIICLLISSPSLNAIPTSKSDVPLNTLNVNNVKRRQSYNNDDEIATACEWRPSSVSTSSISVKKPRRLLIASALLADTSRPLRSRFDSPVSSPKASSTKSKTPFTVRKKWKIGNFEAVAIDMDDSSPQQCTDTITSTPALQNVSDQISIQDISDGKSCNRVQLNVIKSREQVRPPWNLDRIDQQKLPLNGQFEYPNYSLSNVDVIVVDSGIFANHIDFQQAEPAVYVARSNWTREDISGHGTFIGGIISSKSFGVAKGVNMISVKLMESAIECLSVEEILDGLQFVANKVMESRARGRKVIINLSFSLAEQIDVIDDAIGALTQLNASVVIAAGNLGMDACNFTPQSAVRYYPVIVVGSSDLHDNVSSFSNHGECVDLYAPGEDVISVGKDARDAVDIRSGTSFAAPHVTGVIAHLFSITKTASASIMKAYLLHFMTTKDVLKHVPKDSPNRLLLLDMAHYIKMADFERLSPGDSSWGGVGRRALKRPRISSDDGSSSSSS